MYCCMYSARLLMMGREILIPLASSQHNLYVLLCVQC